MHRSSTYQLMGLINVNNHVGTLSIFPHLRKSLHVPFQSLLSSTDHIPISVTTMSLPALNFMKGTTQYATLMPGFLRTTSGF